MMDQVRKKAGAAVLPDALAQVYERAVEEYESEGAFFLRADYIQAVQEKTNGFPRIMEAVLESAAEVRKDRAAAEYALFVCRAMEQRELFRKHLSAINFPGEYPLLPFLCLIPYVERTWEQLTEKELPADVVQQTVRQYEDCVFLHEERFDHLGLAMRYFGHLQNYVDCRILNIGRLRYELDRIEWVYVLEHKETGEQVLFLADGRMNADGLYLDTPPVQEDGAFRVQFRETKDCYVGNPISREGRCERKVRKLLKDEYMIRLRPGDECLSVHIPPQGALTMEACRASYERALEIYGKYYPEHSAKAFHCNSWMLAPELEGILKPGSNLLAFQEPYLRYPAHTKGEDVLNFVFKLRFHTYEDLPEETSLQRELKKWYLGGKYLYEYCGVMLMRKIGGPVI